MSEATWREEFYPEGSMEKVASMEKAIEHSLQKWRGYTPAMQKKHGVSSGVLRVLSTSHDCALCKQCTADDGRFKGLDCDLCPLAATSGMECDACDAPEEGTNMGPWRVFQVLGDPQPMIDALTKTLEEFRK